MPQRVIQMRADAPSKPKPGSACNGCGVCCSAEPCPLGCWLSRRRTGACAALTWNGDSARYECGALSQPGHWLPGMPEWLARRLARRWIAAGIGCDSDYETVTAGNQDRVLP